MLVVMGMVILGGVGTVVQRWYYVNFSWPRDIQMTLFGQEGTSYDDLIRRESFSHLGQGQFRWEYRVKSGNGVVQSLCGTQAVRTCSWSRSARPYRHVIQDAAFRDSVLTFEEWWE